jgi:transmembrane sensor
MRGPDAEAVRSEFEAWLSSGPLHREAYSRAAEIFAMGKVLAEPDQIPSKRRAAPSRLALAAAIAALIAAIAAWPVLRKALPDPQIGKIDSISAQSQQLTAGGGPRSIRLADGSLVRLENAAAVDVRLTTAERILTLEQGSARFYVARERRPFLVYAGGGSVSARGTIFDVGLAANRRVIVRLIAGVVDVRLPASPDSRGPSPPHRLRPGQWLSFAAAPAPIAGPPAGAAQNRQASPGPAPSDYDSVALADLVRLANKDSPRPIRIADPAIGKLSVSGAFRIDDTGLLATRVALLFNLVDDRRDPSVITLGPKDRPRPALGAGRNLFSGRTP